MKIAGHLVEQFGVEDDGVHGRAVLHGAESLVEVPAPPAEAHPAAVDGGSGDDEQIDVIDGERAQHLADGLRHPEQALRDVGAGLRHHPVEQPVGARDGKEDADAARHGIRDELVGSGLGGRRQEAGDRAGPGAGNERVELSLHARGVGRTHRLGALLTALAQIGAQRALRIVDAVGHGPIVGGAATCAAATVMSGSADAGRVWGMSARAIKAVIPAAGLGTRFLPATKAMPKEMLPVVDKPAIQYVVEEAVKAGIDDVLIILGRNKNNISNHFDSVPELESNLLTKGAHEKLRAVQQSTELADIHFVRQGEPKGLGHAVLRARHHVGDSTFAVMLGDDLIDERDELLSKMLAENAASGLTVIALMEVDPDHIHLYGAAAVEPTDDPDVVRVTGLVEKPKKEDAPSNYAVIGRYVLTPGVFDILERTEPGKGGEIQLTDALQELAVTDGVLGVVFRGRRYDTGDRVDYIKAIVQLATDRDDLGPELRPWLKDFAESL